MFSICPIFYKPEVNRKSMRECKLCNFSLLSMKRVKNNTFMTVSLPQVTLLCHLIILDTGILEKSWKLLKSFNHHHQSISTESDHHLKNFLRNIFYCFLLDISSIHYHINKLQPCVCFQLEKNALTFVIIQTCVPFDFTASQKAPSIRNTTFHQKRHLS